MYTDQFLFSKKKTFFSSSIRGHPCDPWLNLGWLKELFWPRISRMHTDQFFFSEKVVWGTWQSATSSSLSFSLPRYRKLFLNSKTFVGNVIKTTATATNADVSDGNVGDDDNDNDDVGDNADMTTMTMTMTQWKLDSCVYLSNNGAKAFIYFTVILNMTTGLDW